MLSYLCAKEANFSHQLTIQHIVCRMYTNQHVVYKYKFMICPFCRTTITKVVDKRDYEDSPVTRRRRECLSCKKRFTTYERMDLNDLMVIKKDNSRQPFSTDKMKSGILKALEKRPVSVEIVNNIINELESYIRTTYINEVTSSQIGEEVMKRLKQLDEIAYIRFASVYRSFTDIETFEKEINSLLQHK